MWLAIAKLIIKLLATEAAKELLLFSAEKLAEQTDNKIDDEVVAKIKEKS